jgi:hypothetical protein
MKIRKRCGSKYVLVLRHVLRYSVIDMRYWVADGIFIIGTSWLDAMQLARMQGRKVLRRRFRLDFGGDGVTPF